MYKKENINNNNSNTLEKNSKTRKNSGKAHYEASRGEVGYSKQQELEEKLYNISLKKQKKNRYKYKKSKGYVLDGFVVNDDEDLY